jgi:hypothetical protein
MMTKWGRRFPDAAVQAATRRGVLKRLAAVDDVAAHVRALVMSNSITGQNVVVDAGVAI